LLQLGNPLKENGGKIPKFAFNVFFGFYLPPIGFAAVNGSSCIQHFLIPDSWSFTHLQKKDDSLKIILSELERKRHQKN
jgi:hypothetical protein